MIRQFELIKRVKSYDSGADEDALNRAYVFSMKAHGAQKRASGAPYFSHPLEVAGILTDYKLDGESIITALLHDTIEDTPATLADIQSQFGKGVARLVDGVTKLTRIELQSDQANQAENFRKLLLAMSEDIRVLLVKLADRLHNMRTLHHIENRDTRRRTALETMEIYSPLAERIGMQEMKNELEGLAFAELNPDARQSVMARLEFLRVGDGDLVSRVTHELENTLAEAGIKATVSGREKTPYSIWRKMQHNNIGFEQLSDVMAFRVITETLEQCYLTLGVIHCAYSMVPGRFKDYISTPKPNGYRSLHTSVFGPERHRIEVQIRTCELHEVAEHGVAAHWQYKQGADKTDGRQYRWLRELLDILDHTEPEEFLEHTKLEMFQDQVFCFTPKGDLISLPRGATLVDFAYAVHSEVGHTCAGAKINGRMMPLRTQLHNGDQVEIITSKAQTPSPTWERFVVTGKARARIQRFVHLKKRGQFLKLGHAILEKAFSGEGYEFSEKTLDEVIIIFKTSSASDLIARVGAGDFTGREILEAVFPGTQKKIRSWSVVPLTRTRRKNKKCKEVAIPIKGLIPGMAVHYAGCCHSLPGDQIVGIVTRGQGVTIHTIDCDVLAGYAEEPERWLDVSWDVESKVPDLHVGRVQLTVTNEPGSLSNLSTIIAKNYGNISNLKITNRSTDFFDMTLDIEVQDLQHLTYIIAALRATPVVNSVHRARG